MKAYDQENTNSIKSETKQTKKEQLAQFLGIGRGYWGNTPEEIDCNIKVLRNSWERGDRADANQE